MKKNFFVSSKEIPSYQRCFELLKLYKVPPHIIKHCKKVALISSFLAKELIKKREKLDIKLVEAGGLLHDLTKHISIKTGENHALSAAQILKELGYPRVAKVVAHHIFLYTPKAHTPITEEEIVFYADKRVKHHKIVSLRERFQDLRVRYGHNNISCLLNLYYLEDLSKLIERRIFKRLKMDPNILKELEND